jgi:hypothetical protein
MVDLAAKVKAIHELTDTWAANGEVEMIDAVLAILQGKSASPKARRNAQYDVSSLHEVPEG